MKVFLAILILLLAFALCPAVVFSQTQEKEFSGYAVRFQIRGDLAEFFPIIGSSIDTGGTVPLFMSRDSPPHYSTRISMISFSAKRQGDEWNLRVSVVLPKVAEMKQLAFARLKTGEKLKVEKFSDYDLLPSEVSIVKIDPVTPLEPQVVNLTSSIAVLKISTSVVPMPFRIVLKNISIKPVQGVEINTYRGPRTWTCLEWPEGSWDRSLIEPSATFKTDMPSAVSYQAVAGGAYRPDQSDTVEIATVVFTDGTFEGKPHLAGIIGAKTIGNRVQLDRVLHLIENALESGDSNTAIGNFKQAVSNLDVDVDQSYSTELRTRFPMLDANTLKDLDGSISSGMEKVKASVLGDIAKFEKKNENNPFHAWLLKELDKYRTWRSRVY